MVLHHGGGGWNAPLALAELYDADEDLLDAAGPHLPTLRLVLDDLSTTSDEAIRARATSALVQLALLVMKHARDSTDIEDRLER